MQFKSNIRIFSQSHPWLEAAVENPQLALRFYRVMHILKPPTTLFALGVMVEVLSWKKAARPAQSTQSMLLIQSSEGEEGAAVQIQREDSVA